MVADGADDRAAETVTIRRAVTADLPAIEAFLHRTYGALAPFKASARLRWQFAENPVSLAAPDHLPVWIATEGGDIIGQIAAQGARFLLDGESHRGGWLVDLMIDEAQRGRGLGNRLFAAAIRDVPFILMLTMAPATRRMAARAGAVTLNAAFLYCLLSGVSANDIRRHILQRLAERPTLRALAVSAFGALRLHAILAALLKGAWALRSRMLQYTNPDLIIEEVGASDAAAEALWRRLSSDLQPCEMRDGRFLQWRYGLCPDLHYRRFRAMRDGQTVGLSILRHPHAVERGFGVIADILVARHDGATYRALVGHAIGHFGNSVAGVQCVTSNPAQARILSRLGFLRARVTRAACLVHDAKLRARLARSPWHFTKGDHDWDQVQPG